MRVNLIYLSPNTTGGWITFTAHLYRALESADVEVHLFKCKDTLEDRYRDFGYGLQYQNRPGWELGELPGINLIVAVSKRKSNGFHEWLEAGVGLLQGGARIIIHDPTELEGNECEIREVIEQEKPKMYVIRKANMARLPGSKLLPHPFETTNQYWNNWDDKRQEACAISRIDFDKHTELLLDANRLLPDNKKIHIYGFENRLYTKFKICPEYPEWEQSKAAYDRTMRAARDICLDHRFMVDMSIIKGDGGGTQYTFLEAMEAGACCIVHEEWIIEGDEMVDCHNCLIAKDGQEIADVIMNTSEKVRREIVENAREVLERHSIETVGIYVRDMLDG